MFVTLPDNYYESDRNKIFVPNSLKKIENIFVEYKKITSIKEFKDFFGDIQEETEEKEDRTQLNIWFSEDLLSYLEIGLPKNQKAVFEVEMQKICNRYCSEISTDRLLQEIKEEIFKIFE